MRLAFDGVEYMMMISFSPVGSRGIPVRVDTSAPEALMISKCPGEPPNVLAFKYAPDLSVQLVECASALLEILVEEDQGLCTLRWYSVIRRKTR